MKQLSAIILIAFAFCSCQSNSTKTETATTKNESSLINSDSTTNISTVPASQMNSNSARPATNPEHGQPFHDCALPVGAPLAAVENTQPATSEVKNIPMEINKEVKLNPAHGQPGHNCDLPVGAPLS